MFDKNILKIPGVSRVLALAALLSVVQGLLIIGIAMGLSFAIVNIWQGAPIVEQLGWIWLFLGCFIVKQIVSTVVASRAEAFGKRAASDVRDQLLSSTFEMGPEGVRKFGSAAVTATLLEGIDTIQDYITIILPKMTAVLLVPLTLLIAMFVLDWVSGIIALVCYPFIILYMVLIGSTAKTRASERYQEFERMSNSFTDTASCIPTLKAFGASKNYSERIYSASERFRELTMKTLRVAMLSSTVLDIFATLALAGVAIMLGFRLVDGTVQFLPALMVLIMVPEYFKPIREFGDDYHATLDGKNALESINEMNAYRPEPRDFLGDIEVHVESTDRVGVFGRSGAGKSTLMDVLSGFTQNSNVHLFIDGQSVDTDSQAWRDRVAYIPQSPYLFNATLRDNLRFYNADASDEEIVRALETVGLTDYLATLPEGLDTVIGRGGTVMSGGQAQRVALGRALLDDNRTVWVLDEPTAHLDIETEYDLKRELLGLMEGRLVFFGTHRLHWLDSMNQAIFLQEGQTCDSDTFLSQATYGPAKAAG